QYSAVTAFGFVSGVVTVTAFEFAFGVATVITGLNLTAESPAIMVVRIS
ncbi:5100_t:CDS:1, partial [Rhizophagus irregularis]